jgi:hypothetical protein
MSDDHRIEIDALDYLGARQKELNLNSRRPQVRKASDLVGPGIGAQAVRITNFSDLLAVFNGFYSAAPGATDAPNSTHPFVGHTVSDAELGGVQIFTSLTNGTVYRRTFLRNPSDASVLYWGSWATV